MKIAGVEILFLTIIVPLLVYRFVNKKYFMTIMLCIEVAVIILTMWCIYDIDHALVVLEKSFTEV